MATALLVIDMQNFFLEMTPEIIPNILTLMSHFRSHSLPVVVTQHGHSKEELTPPFKNQLVRRWGPEGSIATGSRDWELIPDIAAQAVSCMKVRKNTYDAFINTNLQNILQEEDVQRVVVCGVMTDCCCDTTARSAFNRGFETWLVKDACATATRRQHESGLNGFGFAFGDVRKTEEVLTKLE